MTDNYLNWCLQKDVTEWLENALGYEFWLPLYVQGNFNDAAGSENRFIWSFLINRDYVGEELEEYTFDQFEGYPCTDRFEKDGEICYYSRFCQENREPIIFMRSFPTKPNYIEISQEFVHFFQLFHNVQKNQYILEMDDGKEESVLKIVEENQVFVKTNRLKQYLAFKNMSLVVGISNMRHFNKQIGNEYGPSRQSPAIQRKTEELHYALWYQEGVSKSRYLSEVLGKKIIVGMPIENTGIYPFEREREFESFIIGVDEQGNVIEQKCNPSQLANYFGKIRALPTI